MANLWHTWLSIDTRRCVRDWLDPLTRLAVRCVSKQDAGETTRAEASFSLYDHYLAITRPLKALNKVPGSRAIGMRKAMFRALSAYHGRITGERHVVRHLWMWFFFSYTAIYDQCESFILAVHGNQPHVIRSFLGGPPWFLWPQDWVMRTGYWAIHVALADFNHVEALRALVDEELDIGVIDAIDRAYMSDHTWHRWARAENKTWRTAIMVLPDKVTLREGRRQWNELGQRFRRVFRL